MQLWWQQFLLIFQITNVIFCTKKQPWYRTAGPIPHTGRRPMRSFSPEAVATTALWKSVPMLQRIIRTEPDVDKNIRSVCTPPAPLKSQKRTCNIIFLLKLNDKKYNFKFQWRNRYHVPTEVYCILHVCSIRQLSPTWRTAFPAQHLRPSGVLSCWPDGLELTTGFHAGSNEQHRCFMRLLKTYLFALN